MDLGFKLCVRYVNQCRISQALLEESVGRVYRVFGLFGDIHGCGAVLMEVFGHAEGMDFAFRGGEHAPLPELPKLGFGSPPASAAGAVPGLVC